MEPEVGNIISIIGIILSLVGIVISYEGLPIVLQRLRTRRTYRICEKIKFWVLSDISKIIGFSLIILGLGLALLGLLIQL